MPRALIALLVLSAAACGPSSDSPGPVPEAGGPAPPPSADPASVSPPAETYVNDRFGYALTVPAGFDARPAPQNGDGRTFDSPDGETTLTAFGFHDALDDGLQGLAQRARDGIDSLSYEARPDGGVAVSGVTGGDDVYVRGLLRDGIGVLARLRSPSEQDEAEAWADAIDASLRWTD